MGPCIHSLFFALSFTQFLSHMLSVLLAFVKFHALSLLSLPFTDSYSRTWLFYDSDCFLWIWTAYNDGLVFLYVCARILLVRRKQRNWWDDQWGPMGIVLWLRGTITNSQQSFVHSFSLVHWAQRVPMVYNHLVYLLSWRWIWVRDLNDKTWLQYKVSYSGIYTPS